MSGLSYRSGRPLPRGWTEAELAVLTPLAAMKRAPAGAVPAVAAQIGRSVATVYVTLSELRRGVRPMPGAEAPKRPRRAAFDNGLPWTAAELAKLLPLARIRRAKPGEVAAVRRELPGRTANAVWAKLRVLRDMSDEELTAATCASASMREAPRADGSGRSLDVSSQTSAAAVQALAPRTVSPAAGAASEAAPAVRSENWRAAFQARIHKAELRAAHPPEVVERRCMACRVPFKAPSRFRFRCDGCRASHKHATGYDA